MKVLFSDLSDLLARVALLAICAKFTDYPWERSRPSYVPRSGASVVFPITNRAPWGFSHADPSLHQTSSPRPLFEGIPQLGYLRVASKALCFLEDHDAESDDIRS